MSTSPPKQMRRFTLRFARGSECDRLIDILQDEVRSGSLNHHLQQALLYGLPIVTDEVKEIRVSAQRAIAAHRRKRLNRTVDASLTPEPAALADQATHPVDQQPQQLLAPKLESGKYMERLKTMCR